jgi:hypothetical protein
MLKILTIYFMTLLILILGLGLLGYLVEEAQCEAKTISFQSEFSILGGCMINYKGIWINLDNLRGFGDE